MLLGVLTGCFGPPATEEDTNFPDTADYLVRHAGEAHLSAQTWSGTHWIVAESPTTPLCAIGIPTRSELPLTDCPGCEYAFDVSFGPVSQLVGDSCDAFGIDVGDFVWTESYKVGFDEDYIGYYGYSYIVSTMYFEGYGWYPVGYFSQDGDDIRYDWDFLTQYYAY